jgi:hypothetical protein
MKFLRATSLLARPCHGAGRCRPCDERATAAYEPQKRHWFTLPSGRRVPYVAPISRRAWLSGISAALAYAAVGDSIPLLQMCRASAAQPYEGFGSSVTGGAGKPVFHVTTLSGSISASGGLHNILFQGGAGARSNCIIVFDVGGTIVPADSDIRNMSNVTIDGGTAPGPGITIDLSSLSRYFNFEDNCHNVILTKFRIKNTGLNSGGGTGVNDCVSWTGDITPSTGLVLDQMSLVDPADGCIDVTRLSRDVTVQWCILRRRRANTGGFTQAFEAGQSIVGWSGYQVSFHHNIFSGWERNPNCDKQDDGHGTAPAAATSVDFRNNLVWNWADPANPSHGMGYGTQAYGGGKLNAVNNYYHSDTRPANAIVRNGSSPGGGSIYANGNVSLEGINPNVWNSGNNGDNPVSDAGSPFTAPVITQHDALTAAAYARTCAGCRVGGLDASDQAFIATITGIPGLPPVSCGGSIAPSAPLQPTVTQRRVWGVWRA